MKRLLRPAFVVTSCVAAIGCEPQHVNDNPPRLQPPSSESPEQRTARYKEFGVHPLDAEHRMIHQKSDGTCFVQAEKKEPPPKDLMSGERWVEDVAVECPKEFSDPSFGPPPAGDYWIQDQETGECSLGHLAGNPPPPPTTVDCPPALLKK